MFKLTHTFSECAVCPRRFWRDAVDQRHQDQCSIVSPDRLTCVPPPLRSGASRRLCQGRRNGLPYGHQSGAKLDCWQNSGLVLNTVPTQPGCYRMCACVVHVHTLQIHSGGGGSICMQAVAAVAAKANAGQALCPPPMVEAEGVLAAARPQRGRLLVFPHMCPHAIDHRVWSGELLKRG